MSKKSNNQAKAYEYAYLNTLYDEILNIGSQNRKNSSYKAAERAWDTLEDSEKENYK